MRLRFWHMSDVAFTVTLGSQVSITVPANEFGVIVDYQILVPTAMTDITTLTFTPGQNSTVYLDDIFLG